MTLPGSTPRATRIEAKVWRSLWCQAVREWHVVCFGELFVGSLDGLVEDAAADVALCQLGAGGGGEHEGVGGGVGSLRLVCFLCDPALLA